MTPQVEYIHYYKILITISDLKGEGKKGGREGKHRSQ
jgi:hypothetical protein